MAVILATLRWAGWLASLLALPIGAAMISILWADGRSAMATLEGLLVALAVVGAGISASTHRSRARSSGASGRHSSIRSVTVLSMGAMCLLTFSLLIGAPGLRAGVTSLAELLEISLPIAIVLGGYYLALREKHRHPNGPAPGDSRSKAP